MTKPNKILFERFQYLNDHGDAAWLAQPMRWISPQMVGQIIKPAAIIPTQRISPEKASDWWGVYHTLKAAYLPVGDVPYEKADTKYSLSIYRHEYLWDEQALPGAAWEVVLSSEVTGSRQEQLAILGNIYRDKDLQRVVVKENNTWEAPDVSDVTRPSESYQRASAYLETIGQLALKGRDAQDILMAPVDNRGSYL